MQGCAWFHAQQGTSTSCELDTVEYGTHRRMMGDIVRSLAPLDRGGKMIGMLEVSDSPELPLG